MLIIKQHLNKQEKLNLKILIDEISDVYGEFYLTKNKLRLFIKENLNLLFNTVKKGDKLICGEQGIAIITGFAEKEIEIIDLEGKNKKIPSRKYIILLAKDERNANRLLKFIDFHFRKYDLYAKLKRVNPIVKVFYDNYYNFAGGRGKELLLVKKADLTKEFIPYKE